MKSLLQESNPHFFITKEEYLPLYERGVCVLHCSTLIIQLSSPPPTVVICHDRNDSIQVPSPELITNDRLQQYSGV